MNKRLRNFVSAAALAALFVAGPGYAKQQRAPKPIPEQKAPAGDGLARPALWKVSDHDTTIWLFGTIHALPAGISWFDGPIAKAFNGSQLLITEIPDANPSAMQSVVMKTALLPEGETLRGMLSPADKVIYEKALKDLALPAESFDRFEPWFAAITLASLPMIKKGYQPSNGVEAQLGGKAKTTKLPQEGLETVEYQLGLFDKLPRKVQLKYLHEVLAGMDKMGAELEQLVKYWGAGNPEKLATLMNAEESDPQLIDALLYNRNRNWAKWIRARMKQPGAVFIAVGAGHLAGKGSVQQQLAKAGLKAKRVQ